MKTSTRRILCIILLLAIWTKVFTQDQLGVNKLLDAPAPTLEGPIHRRINLLSPAFVGRVGGVAFGAVAKPAGSGFRSLSLSYHPEKRDGNRLWVTVDGKDFSTAIYDWQFIPIAKFANSPFKSCVTLFGELENREEGRRLLNNGDGVLNYHPAFVHTLLGLRLFQLDILIDEAYATELPTQNGRYILGAGEAPPDSDANIGGWNALVRFREQLGSELRVKTRSYVITDEGRDVLFSFDGGGLRFTGEPYIFFFLLKEEVPGYDEASLRATIAEQASREARAASLSGLPAGETEAYITMLLAELQYDGRFDDLELPTWLAALKDIQGDSARRTYLRRYTVNSLRNAVIELRVVADANTVVPLREYTQRISRETAMLRRINPAIWDTGVNVMRYAAFFRYYKSEHPADWHAFLSRLNGVSVYPQVRTPSIMKRTR